MSEPTPPPHVNLNREDRILDAAAELIAHYGYDKTTVDDIAREAQVAKGTVYLHFASKEELAETLIVRETERMLNSIIAKLDADPKGVTIFNLYRYSLSELAAYPLLKAMYTQDRRTLGEFLRRVQTLPIYNRGGEFGADFVRGMQSAGLIRKDMDAGALAYVLVALRYGFLNVDDQIFNDHMPALDLIGETLATMLERAIAPTDDSETDLQAGRVVLNQLLDRGREAMRQWKQTLDQARYQRRRPKSGVHSQ